MLVLVQSRVEFTFTLVELKGDLTSLPVFIKGQASQLGPLHFFMPGTSRFFLLGGGRGTLDFTNFLFRLWVLLKATIGGEGKTFFRYGSVVITLQCF